MIDSIRIKSRFWILPYFNYRFHYTCRSKSFQYDLLVFITFRLAIISGKAISDKYKPSPLFQGGLEIPIKVFLNWADEKSLRYGLCRQFIKNLKRFAWGEHGGRRRRSGSMQNTRM